MRIHTENAEGFIHSLAASISKDPSSLDRWCCLHIHPLQPEPLYTSTLQMLKDGHKHVDCDLVVCPDQDILLISHEADAGVLNAFTTALISGPAEIVLYHLFQDWRRIRVMLSAKTQGARAAVAQPAPISTFKEVASLCDAFAEAKHLRKSRLPLHVMLVEDDPVTRRLVTGAFKENYALITAENAEEAVANYLLHAPDIVFLDIGLPDTSGFDVLRQILLSDPEAYVVMFSGNSYLDNVTSALSAGASGFVAKPFKKEKLRHYIQDSALHHHKYSA